jgi:hypothetical protein
MNLKKNLIIIFGTILMLFTVLYIIEIIDKKINGRDYVAIREYIKKTNVSIKEYGHCSFNEDIKNATDNMLKNNNENPYSKKYYEQMVSDCQSLKKQIQDEPIPTLKLETKEHYLQNFKEGLLLAIDNYVEYLDEYIENGSIDNAKPLNDVKMNTDRQIKIIQITPSLMNALTTNSVKDNVKTKPILFVITLYSNRAEKITRELGTK